MPSSDFDDSAILSEEEAKQLKPSFTTVAGEVNPISQRSSDLLEIKNELNKIRRTNASPKVSFDSKANTLLIGNRSVKLDPYSKEALLCKTIFKKPLTKVWEIEDVRLGWSSNENDYTNRSVTDAARRLNDKTKHLVDAKLFLTKAKTISVNPKFIP